MRRGLSGAANNKSDQGTCEATLRKGCQTGTSFSTFLNPVCPGQQQRILQSSQSKADVAHPTATESLAAATDVRSTQLEQLSILEISPGLGDGEIVLSRQSSPYYGLSFINRTHGSCSSRPTWFRGARLTDVSLS